MCLIRDHLSTICSSNRLRCIWINDPGSEREESRTMASVHSRESAVAHVCPDLLPSDSVGFSQPPRLSHISFISEETCGQILSISSGREVNLLILSLSESLTFSDRSQRSIRSMLNYDSFVFFALNQTWSTVCWHSASFRQLPASM